MSVRLAAETAREHWEEGLAEVDLEFTMKGPTPMPAISGGTLQTFAAVLGGGDPARIADPAALVTDASRAAEIRRRSPPTFAPRRGERGAVIAPMFPAPFVNPAVIHRTAALLAADDGGDVFRYREGFALHGSAASLPLRFVAAGAMASPQAAMRRVTRARPTIRRRVAGAMRSILPSSGYGPTPDRLGGWRWGMSVTARTSGGHQLGVEVDSEGHVGFLATARMLGEAGLMLAEAGATPDRAGCLTPAIALGTGAVERLERARLSFSITA